MVPRDEAAVRIALGSDEGPLSIDGRAAGRPARIGEVLPLTTGRHTLEVRAADGHTSRASVVLRQGDVAMLTLHTTPGSAVFDVLKWGSTGAAVLGLAIGGTFQLLSYLDAREFQLAANTRDPASGLPLISYHDVQAINDSRVLNQELAIGFFIGGGVMATVAVILWAQPRPNAERAPGERRAMLEPRLNGFALRF
jgi:hypothetical protein